MIDQVYVGDVMDFAAQLPPQSVQTIVTSPPYFGLRSYLASDHPDKAREIGAEPTPQEYVARLVTVFRALWPALKDDGTLWLNLGSSYNTQRAGNKTPSGFSQTRPSRISGNGDQETVDVGGGLLPGFKPKDDLMIPYRAAIALQEDGWYVRSTIVWAKPNPMPESVTDRPTRSHEYIFLLSKQPRYYYDAASIAEPAGPFKPCGPNSRADNDRDPMHGTRKQDALNLRTYAGFNERWAERPTTTRNKRDVWTIPTTPYPDAHYATFPPELIRPCILAGSRPGDVVCDPFGGSGTTPLVAVQERRRWVACDLDERAVGWTARRLAGAQVRLGA